MKKAIFFSLIIVFIIGACTQNNETKLQLDEFTAQKNLEIQNKALAQKVIDGLNARDTTFYAELYSPDCKIYFPSASPTPISIKEDMEDTKINWELVPDLKWEIKEIIAEGNMVAVMYTATGTPKEEWFGVPYSGKKFETGGMFIVIIENGKIIESREDYDLLGTMMQLGMELQVSDKK